MKRYFRAAILSIALAAATSASAQLYEIANQIPQLIQPALSGSVNYKGFVETGFAGGVGNYKANVLSISTSQGFRYGNWFYMGVGIGLDVMFGQDTGVRTPDNPDYNEWDSYYNHSNTTTAYFLPLFTDFRFNIGANEKGRASAFIDVKVGASFMLNNSYFQVGGGYITNRENFYLKPSIGVRIPVSSKNSHQAISIGASYQLVTANWWYVGSRNICLSAIGGTVAFEW